MFLENVVILFFVWIIMKYEKSDCVGNIIFGICEFYNFKLCYKNNN